MLPTLSFTDAEQQNQHIQPNTLEKAAQLFRTKGCLVLERVFRPEFITELQSHFLETYHTYFHEAEFDDALTVGDKRYKISVDLQSPFGTSYFYANPLVLPIIKHLLGDQTILSSMVSVTALPDAPEQHLHRDHPWLFGTVLDRMIPSYAIKLIVPLLDLDEMSGTTKVWPGTQIVFDDKALTMDSIEPFLSRGDCLLMDYRLLHQGTANRSEQVRPIMFLSYSRPWFRDHENFKKQDRLTVSHETFQKIPTEHRALFAWLELETVTAV